MDHSVVRKVKSKLRKVLEKGPLGYRLVLVRDGAAWRPNRVPSAWMNTTLKSKQQWEEAAATVAHAGLLPHRDTQKNWDHLAALSFILQNTDTNAKILDAGGEFYSPLVQWLFLYGYSNLHVINLAFEKNFVLGPIRYEQGDCTKTPYPSAHFDIITCLSVIEHGVPSDRFLGECKRLLRPGGYLIVSTDYWSSPIDTSNQRAFGEQVKVFTPAEVESFIGLARKNGFVPTGEVDYMTGEKAVRWRAVELDFTFIVFALRKGPE